MTALSEKILASYQVRKTKKQKTAFIDMMKQEFPELRVEEGGSLKSRNLIVGDISKARVVLGAHYDTCAALPFPNFMMPKNMLMTVLYSVLIALPFLALMFLTEICVYWLTKDSLIAFYASFVVLWASMIFVMYIGVPNKHTVNDNTSGVITLLEIMARCREKGITDVAFVFFDHEEIGLVGSAFFRKKHKKEMKNRLLINFDCVSDGDHMLFVLNKPAMKQYRDILSASLPVYEGKTAYLEKSSTTFYPSDQMGFPVSIAVSAMKRLRFFGLYLDRIHTKRDTVMDESNIAYLCEGMMSFLASFHQENT